MKTFKRIFLLGLVLIVLSSCAKIFYSPDANVLAQKQRIIAIVPPTVSIAPNKKIDAEALREQQKTESINFQKEMYAWMLKRKMQGKIVQEIQETEITNVKLKKAGYPESGLTPWEICEVLGVDGIMNSNYSLSKPMSEGAALAIGVVFGSWGSTNKVDISLNISDCSSKKLIYNYDHHFSGGVGSSPATLVNEMMRDASKKMPYINKLER